MGKKILQDVMDGIDQLVREKELNTINWYDVEKIINENLNHDLKGIKRWMKETHPGLYERWIREIIVPNPDDLAYDADVSSEDEN